MVTGIGRVLSNLSETSQFTLFFHLSSSYAGSDPMWAVLVRYFWWISVFLLGIIICISIILRRKYISEVQRIEIGGLAAVTMLTIIMILVSPGGAEFYRFLLYASFFTVPILLRYVITLPDRKRFVCAIVAFPLFFCLSFPTFLSHNNQVGLSNIYDSELKAGSFLRQITTARGDDLSVFIDPNNVGLLLFEIPEAHYAPTGQVAELHVQDDYWRSLESSVTNFKNNVISKSAFYMSSRRIISTAHLLGISPDDPHWKQIEKELDDSSDKVYVNSTSIIYE
jgi:hypothetical protein